MGAAHPRDRAAGIHGGIVARHRVLAAILGPHERARRVGEALVLVEERGILVGLLNAGRKGRD